MYTLYEIRDPFAGFLGTVEASCPEHAAEVCYADVDPQDLPAYCWVREADSADSDDWIKIELGGPCTPLF